MNYRAYGLTFASPIPLPRFSPVADAEPTLTFTLAPALSDHREWTWLPIHELQDGRIPLKVATCRGAYLLRLESGAEFVIDSDGRRITYCSDVTMEPEALAHAFVDQVMPRVLSHWGRLVMHASACLLPGGAVAFVGGSGSGKSTLVASFGRLQNASLMADDTLVVEPCRDGLLALPGQVGVRMCPDVHALFGGGPDLRVSDRPALLQRMYLLDAVSEEPGTRDIRLIRLSRREALVEVVKGSYTMDLSDSGRLAAHFTRAADSIAAIEVARLTYPRDLACLPHVHAAILNDMRR